MKTTDDLTSQDAAAPDTDASPPRTSRRRLLPVHLAVLSAAAGAIHLAVASEHLQFWWLHGAFFLAVGLAQVGWAGMVLVAPRRWLFQGAVAGNAIVVVAWVVSRTAGVPIGPGAGIAEPVGVADSLATAFEVAIVAGAVVWLRRGAREHPPAASLLPLAVFAGAVVALASWGIVDNSAGGGGHAHAAGVGAPGGGGHHGSAGPIAADDPLLLDIQAAIDTGGTTAGLDLLERRAAADSAVQALSHQYVHALGRYVYLTAPSPARAFGSCDGRFEAGCYHGVLQGYFEDNPDFTGQDLDGLCAELGADALELKFQCLHGLGHGLTLFFDHTLLRPLRYCDFLSVGWDRKSCYGGVFMENVLWGQTIRGGQTGSPGESAIAEDLQYPCNAVVDKYRPDCWLLQTSTILDVLAWDFRAAFQECGRAPDPYVPICYQSMGRDISGYTLAEPVRSAELCRLGDAEWMGECFAGAARQLVYADAQTTDAFELCNRAPSAVQATCRTAVAQMANFFWRADPARLRAECARAGDPRRVAECEQAAGV